MWRHVVRSSTCFVRHPPTTTRLITCGQTAHTSNLSHSTFGKLLLELPQPRSINAVYKAAVRYLEDNVIPEPETSARYLLSQVAEIAYSPSAFYQQQQRVMSFSELDLFSSHITRRATREPVQYILGDWDFYGLKFLCRAPVLIPRPETEELVDLVLESLGAHPEASDPASERKRNHPWRILDIGTGSGVIGVTLLKLLPHATCTAIDIDPHAVALARQNAIRLLPSSASASASAENHPAERHDDTVVRHNDTAMSHKKEVISCGVSGSQDSTPSASSSSPSPFSSRYRLLHCSVQELARRCEEHGRYDLIVSNPPYIPTAELNTLEPEVIQFESDVALHGGTDGLDVVRDILRLTPSLLSNNNNNNDHSRNSNKPNNSGTCGGEDRCGDGAVDVSSKLLWMEVSHTHPQRIEHIVESRLLCNSGGGGGSSSSSSSGSYVFSGGFNDLFGQPRFVKLELTTTSEPSHQLPPDSK